MPVSHLRLGGALLLALVLGAGCKPAQSPAAGAGGAAKPKIVLVMKSLANDFFATMAAGARRHHESHATEYDLEVTGIRNETDLAGQVSLVEQALAQGAAAIVIAPADSKALVPVLRRAQQQGVLVVNIDNRLDAGTASEAGLKAPFVGPDNRAGARAVGEAVAARLHAGDAVAIIEGVTTAFNGQQRRAGFEDAMAAAGMKVVTVQSGQWEMDAANAVAAGILAAHGEVKAILCANDSMAIGAAAAVTAAGRSGAVLVAGFDDIPAIRPLLADGRVLATADQHADQLAVLGIEAALGELRHGAVGDRATPVDLVTR